MDQDKWWFQSATDVLLRSGLPLILLREDRGIDLGQGINWNVALYRFILVILFIFIK